MCLLVIAWQAHARYRLIVAANRDEYHARPAAALGWWSTGATDILGGRDLQAGGTWLALDAAGRFGVVTNYRDREPPLPSAPSRGRLIPGYLSRPGGAREFMAALAPDAGRYSGFNLLIADRDELWYASNRGHPFARALPPGIYGLSNHLLDTPWPKLARVRAAFGAWIEASGAVRESTDAEQGDSRTGVGPDRRAVAEDAERLMEMLADRTPVVQGDAALAAQAGETIPAQGGEVLAAQAGETPAARDREALERALSAPFVKHPLYGTRCSTVVLLEAGGSLAVRERRFDAAGAASGETEVTLETGAGRESE